MPARLPDGSPCGESAHFSQRRANRRRCALEFLGQGEHLRIRSLLNRCSGLRMSYRIAPTGHVPCPGGG
jgi:hypothetical protein